MRKFLFIALGLLAIVGMSQTAVAQTNQHEFHNGIEYFFFNPVVPPTNATSAVRQFGTASSLGGTSGATEGNIHPQGVQQDGFEAWNGQAGPPAPTGSFPLGFSLMEFRRNGTFRRASGSVVASASWLTSLPCSAPWFWIVTFGWGTAFTQTASAGPVGQNFHFNIRGETKQTIGNQNYFTGSGNERNLNTGGISFLEDTITGTSFQLVGRQEWSPSLYTADAVNRHGRDPSGVLGFGLDFGTGNASVRHAGTTINPGNPIDSTQIRIRAQQELTGTAEQTLSVVTSAATGGGVVTSGGPLTLPAGDGRALNIVPDATIFPLGLSVSIVLKTGGGLGALTGDIGLSGTATTLAVDLSGVTVPPAISPLTVFSQAIGIKAGAFTILSNVGDITLR